MKESLMRITPRFVDLLALYRAELLERVVPFWLTHAIDWPNGGILTCISDDGQVLSTDKYMWSQLRAIWTFSALYNRIEARQEWLDVARHIFDFAKKYGRDEQGQWVFCVNQAGQILQGATSIYADGFAMYGLTEFARATGDSAAIDLALETYENVQRRLARPGSYNTEPYPLPAGVKAHGISMIFSLVFHQLGRFLNRQDIIEAGLYHAREVMDVYRRPEQKLLYEFTYLDGSLLDSPQGRAIVPGHAIESMWFMMHIFRRFGDAERIRRAIETIKWHVELGWDDEYGGLLLARDAAGGTPWWKFADSKIWWPHTEALYALLLAYELSKEKWCLDWFARVHNYAFSHYPVTPYGEWTQKLDRQGRKFTETVALPVKDPFHLPRALIYCIEVLERLADKAPGVIAAV
ncbi:MAG: AGE family epimerase/isomerase [Anaerolineales bacterium]|nr:AGE family epimerase/isomerase [Anaerolineales bacterium]